MKTKLHRQLDRADFYISRLKLALNLNDTTGAKYYSDKLKDIMEKIFTEIEGIQVRVNEVKAKLTDIQKLAQQITGLG